MSFLSFVCYAFVHVWSLMPCGHLLGKGCHFPIGILGQVWCLVYRFMIFALFHTFIAWRYFTRRRDVIMINTIFSGTGSYLFACHDKSYLVVNV